MIFSHFLKIRSPFVRGNGFHQASAINMSTLSKRICLMDKKK